MSYLAFQLRPGLNMPKAPPPSLIDQRQRQAKVIQQVKDRQKTKTKRDLIKERAERELAHGSDTDSDLERDRGSDTHTNNQGEDSADEDGGSDRLSDDGDDRRSTDDNPDTQGKVNKVKREERDDNPDTQGKVNKVKREERNDNPDTQGKDNKVKREPERDDNPDTQGKDNRVEGDTPVESPESALPEAEKPSSFPSFVVNDSSRIEVIAVSHSFQESMAKNHFSSNSVEASA
jgi:hypothetical protein